MRQYVPWGIAGIVLLGALTLAIQAQSKAVACAKLWNEAQRDRACVAGDDDKHGPKGDRYVCENDKDAAQRRPTTIPGGYRMVYFTTGCSDCAVGWVLKKGRQCKDGEWDCAN